MKNNFLKFSLAITIIATSIPVFGNVIDSSDSGGGVSNPGIVGERDRINAQLVADQAVRRLGEQGQAKVVTVSAGEITRAATKLRRLDIHRLDAIDLEFSKAMIPLFPEPRKVETQAKQLTTKRIVFKDIASGAIFQLNRATDDSNYLAFVRAAKMCLEEIAGTEADAKVQYINNSESCIGIRKDHLIGTLKTLSIMAKKDLEAIIQEIDSDSAKAKEYADLLSMDDELKVDGIKNLRWGSSYMAYKMRRIGGLVDSNLTQILQGEQMHMCKTAKCASGK